MTDRADVRARSRAADTSVIPALGFGTYRLSGHACFDATRAAIEAGYRHVDTAMAYDNEPSVGRAIDVAGVPRSELFLTTKIKGYPRYLEHDALIAAAEGCLDRLGTDYVDLLLLHWWNSAADMAEAFGALDTLVESGRVRHIGVSNFSVPQLEAAIRAADSPIVTNQVEYHPYFSQAAMLECCREHEMILTAYSPLAEGRVVDDEVLAEIGTRYGKTPAQVAIRWLIQQPNVVTIPKASSETHIRANLEVFDFSLSDEEMTRIEGLKGPLWYRLNADDGPITRARASIGPYVPRSIRAAIS